MDHVRERFERDLPQTLSRGVAWNLLGQILPVLLSLAATPILVGRLGVHLYGIYMLAGVVLSYFSFLDLGLNTASIRFLSHYLAENDEGRIRAAFWSCVVFHWIVGTLGAAVLFFGADSLVGWLLSGQKDLFGMAALALRISAVSLVVSVYLGLATGILRSLGRFGTLMGISMGVGTLQTALSVILVLAGYSLPEILWSNIGCQVLSLISQGWVCMTDLPCLRKPRFDGKQLGEMVRYGGFVTLSGLTGPVLTNLEKVYLTRLDSVRSLTYYSVPFALVDRLSMIPAAFSSVILPALSYHDGTRSTTREIRYRSTLYVFYVYALFAAFFTLLGDRFLEAWLGADFSRTSYGVLCILVLGGMINASARPPLAVIQAAGKPELPACFHLLETLFYIPAAYYLTREHGITGAAAVWGLRVALDAVLLHVAAGVVSGDSQLRWLRNLLKDGLGPLAFCLFSFYLLRLTGLELTHPALLMGVVLTALGYALIVWKWGLDEYARRKIGIMVFSWK